MEAPLEDHHQALEDRQQQTQGIFSVFLLEAVLEVTPAAARSIYASLPRYNTFQKNFRHKVSSSSCSLQRITACFALKFPSFSGPFNIQVVHFYLILREALRSSQKFHFSCSLNLNTICFHLRRSHLPKLSLHQGRL